MEDSEEERSDIEEGTVGEQSEDVRGRTTAGHGMEPRSRGVFEELWEEEEADELKDEEDKAEENASVKTEPKTEVKTEHVEETEPYAESGYYETEEVYETEPSREERSQYGPSAYPGYGGVYYAGPEYGYSIALTHAVSNAVKVLPLFHSAGVTVEKARDFWEAFEDTTRGLPDRSRLLVFRQKIKGSEAERWWNNSSIKTFETLKIRFHNHFLSRTADELSELLHSTKRARGESIEDWGDRVSDLCDSLDYSDPRMRYQLFRRGLNNRSMQAILDSSPACAIPGACEWLMAKDMYRPADEDEDFDDGTAVKNGSKSEKSSLLLSVLDQVNALAQEVRTFVKGEKEWRNKVNNQLQATRQNAYQAPSTVAAIPPPTQPARPSPPRQQGNGRPFRGIRMEEDSRAQDGAPICGRCHFLGHDRETCRRRSMTCRRCNQFGHVIAECEQPSNSGYYTSERRHCALCDDNSHSTSQCPAIARLRALDAQQNAVAGQAEPRL
ncbi:unnamed protein product [Phytophthora fragariaefolia]|uniref:Unnamed protein product n=1 Tax=Phytophthora fragariaefolia TaxID=1490495 RepID=A0A9W7CWL9_9STRA|nr:unnamed protein product [Phytophthora fragariaefolia]